MNKKIFSHPALTFSQDIIDICKPLLKLNITYFAHTRVNKKNEFAGLSNNPYFTEHYLKNKYYNADIHLAATQHDQSIMWDAIERRGKSLKMHEEAAAFGVQHTFTIIEKKNGITDCYHFANHSSCRSINQTYLTQLHLLKIFIAFFKENIEKSSCLSKAFDLKFKIDHAANYDTKNYCIPETHQQRLQFMHELTFHPKNHEITIAPQKLKCLMLLAQGFSAKQIGLKLHLSTRTVENYLANLRKQLNCRNSKELIANYCSLLLRC
ncbi:MAG TPA: LuxR C-terminal-related transcriptional regulator [Gammaproteobacteria bacterium]|jgi:DNA-binding CsgD family transcriptional regulator|nr:LuxR C-terminal-related transcriptional regulator [Gammaproteobacteria bacterium]